MFKLSVALFLLALCTNRIYAEDATTTGVESNQASNPDEGTPSKLLEGVINFNFEAVDNALAEGESINLVNVNEWSAARFAVAASDLDMLAHLIDREIDLNIPDNQGVTPLMVAAAQCDKDMVELLLRHNANPLAVDNNGTSAFDYAFNAGRKFLALLIAEQSTLYSIASGDMSGVLKSVIDQGAYVNIRNDVGYTPLIFAAHENNLDAVQKLINHGSDPSRVEADGWSALHFACDYGNKEIVKILMDAKVDYTLRTFKENKTARDFAVDKDPEILHMIPENVEQDL